MAGRRKPAERYHHGNLRSALLGAAWSHVARHGVESLSLRAIAEALGVSHAAPAWHFKDKAALVQALRLEAWGRFADALEAGGAQSGEGDRLRGTGRAYLDFAARHPRQMALMFRQGSGPHPPEPCEPEEIGVQQLRAWGALTGAVAQAIGPKRAEDAARLAGLSLAAWSTVHGLASLLVEVPLPPGLAGPGLRDALVEQVLEVAVRGVTSAARKRE